MHQHDGLVAILAYRREINEGDSRPARLKELHGLLTGMVASFRGGIRIIRAPRKAGAVA
jgi:hypothetical protein